MRIDDMDRDDEAVPAEVLKEAGELISELLGTGWTVYGVRYDAWLFGNWYVDLGSKAKSILLTKDRSQYMFSAFSDDGKPLATFDRAYDSFAEYQLAVMNWVLR